MSLEIVGKSGDRSDSHLRRVFKFDRDVGIIRAMDWPGANLELTRFQIISIIMIKIVFDGYEDNDNSDWDLYIIGAVCLCVCNEKVTIFFDKIIFSWKKMFV